MWSRQSPFTSACDPLIQAERRFKARCLDRSRWDLFPCRGPVVPCRTLPFSIRDSQLRCQTAGCQTSRSEDDISTQKSPNGEFAGAPVRLRFQIATAPSATLPLRSHTSSGISPNLLYNRYFQKQHLH